MLLRATALAAVAVLAASSALAQAPTPRASADEIARVIEDNYFDPAKGRSVAESLRAAAARGELDGFADPRDLATELTRRLKPQDAHFSAQYAPGAPAGAEPGGSRRVLRPAGGPPAPGAAGPVRVRVGPGPSDAERRGNYGFRRVEILPGAVGYLDMRSFAGFDFADPDAPARKAAEAALQLLSGTDAVIVDLRENGGGSPAMVGYLVSAFTPAGADIYNTFHERSGTTDERPAQTYPAPRLDVPIYVLTSGRTGSAAEAFAYTLQAAKRATVVGEASGGGANPGGYISTPGGWRVFVSTGAPINPITKTNWEGKGVQPDVAVPAGEALTRARRLALERIVASGRPEPQLTEARWALEAMSPGAAPELTAYAGEYSGARIVVAGDALEWRRDRRPAQRLVPLAERDLFTVAEDPSRRLAFTRGPDGKIEAVELRAADGPTTRFRKTGA